MLRATTMFLRFLLVALLSLRPDSSSAGPSQGKDPCGADSRIPFARIGLHRLCQLARRPEVKAATGAVDGLDLMAKVPSDILWRISDQDLANYFLLYSDSLGELAPASCSEFAPRPKDSNWGSRFEELATAADSALSVRWADHLESWVWAVVHKDPHRPEATPTEALTFLRALGPEFSLTDRQVLQRLRRSEAVPHKAACAVTRKIYRVLGQQPAIAVARVVRALMSGTVSFFTAV
jgi:hypothetical protein